VEVSHELAAIFDRLRTNAETWWARIAKLSQGRLFGRVYAATCQRLRETASRLGVRRLAHLRRRAARSPLTSAAVLSRPAASLSSLAKADSRSAAGARRASGCDACPSR
jgi:hypothetical protein